MADQGVEDQKKKSVMSKIKDRVKMLISDTVYKLREYVATGTGGRGK